jgi:hypothetical protein
LDLRFKSYGVLKISATLWAGSQPLLMQQFLPKTAQRQNFEIPPKIEILVFFLNNFFFIEEKLEQVSTVWIFNLNFFHMLFLLSKNGLCM